MGFLRLNLKKAWSRYLRIQRHFPFFLSNELGMRESYDVVNAALRDDDEEEGGEDEENEENK